MTLSPTAGQKNIKQEIRKIRKKTHTKSKTKKMHVKIYRSVEFNARKESLEIANSIKKLAHHMWICSPDGVNVCVPYVLCVI